jgi:cation diffusion facilitator CzcD-associated flavoprotein CzcO
MASESTTAVTHLDVAIVGAGLSGIGAGHYLQSECPWADYAIFEARDAIGGTWDLFRYPGIRSDSDMHTLGYSFRPWDGEKSIADGDSILQYIKDTARESGIDTHIRFNHRITAADWSSADSLWHLTAERTDTGEAVAMTASFLFSCSGYYRYDHGYLPDFEGMADFTGILTQAFYQLSRKYPKLVRRMLAKGLERQLPPGYDVATHFTPRYDPWDQRFCAVPNGDLFKSLSSGDASVVTDQIERFTEKGLLLTSGDELEADIIVTATGLELLFLGGIDLRVDGERVDPATRLTYKGMMIEGVPNLALAIGYTNASWTLKCDLTCDYVCRLLNHMRARGVTKCVARDHGAAAAAGPILGLTSGYIQRSAHLLPKQGTTHPWKVHQSYLRDYRALKMSDVDDSVMDFSGSPTPATALEPVAS